MKRFEKRNRKMDWKRMIESSYEMGYQEGDYLFMAGYRAALPRRQADNSPQESEQMGSRQAPPSPAAIPYVNG